MAGISPTQRTLKYLRDRGYECGIVERYNSYSRTRSDLFGIIDIISIAKGELIGVQSCGQSFSEHEKKILGSPYTKQWLESGAMLWLIGWRKVKKKRGGKLMIWAPRLKYFTLDNIDRGE